MSEEPGQRRFPVARNLKVEELIEQYDQVIPQVDEQLEASSISDDLPMPLPSPDIEQMLQVGSHGDPLLPDDLTELTLLNLGKLYSFLTNWTNYVQSELTRAQAALSVLARNASVVEAALSIWYREEMGKPASMVSDHIATDSRYVEMDTAVLRAKVYVEKVKTRYEQMKRALNLISREQTRRGEEYGNNAHEDGGPLKVAPSMWKRSGLRKAK